ncbi:hypothetical protein EVAR_40010_1 [Eumeta japonica]|uniref:Uncharacterized protein n=1 Tax=Eumeta variegata TaxID=151549 RepID=A0A4C1YSF1_EUMVA|nr:hypothetical protein EVAR_40010_1 [Eumeta japonica]
MNKAYPALHKGAGAREPGVLELLCIPVTTLSRHGREYWYCQRIPPRTCPGHFYRIGGRQISYREIGSSRLDYDDEVCNQSRLVPRRGETRTKEIRLVTMNVCGGMDNKIDDICELIKDRRLEIICMNESKRKESGGATKD